MPGLCLVAGLLVTACGDSAAVRPTPGPDVWAVVDGREISRADVELASRAMVQPSPVPPSESEQLTTYLNVLDELITQDILAARATATGLVASESEVDAAFAERRGELTDAEMTERMGQRGLTQADVRTVLRREILVEKLFERDVAAKAVVTDPEVVAFFEANRDRFSLAEAQYRIAQIIITPVRDPQVANRMNDDATTADQARQKAAMLFERLRGGADFGTLAADYSEDPESAPQGGDLGFIPESALRQAPPQMRDLVLKMEPGNVNTLEAGGGFTIVLLVAKEPAGQRDLAMPGVRENIREGLTQQKDSLLRTAYIAEARHSAVVDHRLARAVVAGEGQPPPGLLGAGS